jgi:hypothetical protein
VISNLGGGGGDENADWSRSSNSCAPLGTASGSVVVVSNSVVVDWMLRDGDRSCVTKRP